MTEEKKEVKEEARRTTRENWGRVQILIYCNKNQIGGSHEKNSLYHFNLLKFVFY
jgi:hypothetical protein